MWNGAAPTLNKNPIATNSAPRWNKLESGAAARASKRTLPVAPQSSATPYKKIDEANEPRTKYLSAASFDLTWLRKKPHKT